MIKYEDLTIEQIDFIKNADVICDGDNKQAIIEGTDESE